MQLTQGNMLATLRNVRAYLDANAATLEHVVTLGTRTKLETAIAELTDHGGAQNTHTRAALSALARRRQKRAELLRNHMVPVAKIAKLELSHVPEFLSLTLPRRQPSTEQLAALATGMADTAQKYSDTFLDAGRKPDFVDRMKTAAADMIAAASDRATSRGRAKSAGSELRAKLIRGRKVLQMLDAFVKEAVSDQPGLIASWQLTKRVPRYRGSAATPSASISTSDATPDITPAATPLTVAA